MRATYSSTCAFSTALAGVGPHVNGPWLPTSTAGISSGERPRSRNVSTITRPVFRS